MLWNKLGQLEHLITPPLSISRETKVKWLWKSCLEPCSYSREDLCAPACSQREEARSQVTSRIYCSATVPRHWHGDAQDDHGHHSRDELCRGRSVPPLAQTKDAQHQHASAHHLQDAHMERWRDGEMARWIDEKLFKRRAMAISGDLVEETSAQRHVLCRIRGKYWRCLIWTIYGQHSSTEVHDGILDTNREWKKLYMGCWS